MTTISSGSTPATSRAAGSASGAVGAMRVAVVLARVLVGGLFVFAGVMKLRDPQQFAFSVNAFKLGLPDHLTILTTFVVPWTELVAGALLVLGIWSRAAAMLIAMLLIAFVGGILSVIVRGFEASCGCFGKFEWPCGSKIGMCQVGRNCVLLALTLFCFFKSPRDPVGG